MMVKLRNTILIAALIMPLVTSCRGKDQEKWSAAKDDAVYVDASVDKTVGAIGDRIRYAIKVKYKKDLTVAFPDYKGDIGGLTIKDAGEKPVKRYGDYLQAERWYRLETLTPGAYVIEPALITCRDPKGAVRELKTPQLFVDIKTTLKEGDKAADIRDIKFPVFLKENLLVYLAVIGGLLLAGALGYVLWRYIRRRKALKLLNTPPRPAHEVAFEELENLLKMDLVRQGRVKEYYQIMSDIVRRYIEKRFAIKAKEQTTQEFLNEIAFSKTLDDEPKKVIADFLVSCDMVKFAKYGAVPSEAEEAYSLARRFVTDTAPIVLPAVHAGQNSKHEARNSKQIQNSNFQNTR